MSTLSKSKSKRSVLVVAAHPDDEVLGCGATMAKHARAGDDVHVLILAEGITSRDRTRELPKRQMELGRLRDCSKRANRILGVKTVTFQEFPDNRMDSIDLLDVVKVVEDHIARRRPWRVYTHHGSDVNIDHQKVHQATVTACRPLPGQGVKSLLFFEVPSSTEWRPARGSSFVPNWFSNVSKTLSLKLKALRAYGSEMRPWPHSRSLRAIEHLARWRGATVGVEAAESFVLGRRIE